MNNNNNTNQNNNIGQNNNQHDNQHNNNQSNNNQRVNQRQFIANHIENILPGNFAQMSWEEGREALLNGFQKIEGAFNQMTDNLIIIRDDVQELKVGQAEILAILRGDNNRNRNTGNGRYTRRGRR